jgi:hypothetical protein
MDTNVGGNPSLKEAVKVLNAAGFRVFDVIQTYSGNTTAEKVDACDSSIRLSITPFKHHSVEKGQGFPVVES